MKKAKRIAQKIAAKRRARETRPNKGARTSTALGAKRAAIRRERTPWVDSGTLPAGWFFPGDVIEAFFEASVDAQRDDHTRADHGGPCDTATEEG